MLRFRSLTRIIISIIFLSSLAISGNGKVIHVARRKDDQAMGQVGVMKGMREFLLVDLIIICIIIGTLRGNLMRDNLITM